MNEDLIMLTKEKITETLHLLSVPGMRESIVRGMKTPVSKCSKDPGW